MADAPDHDQLISEFCSLTGATPTDARQFLVANQWNLGGAATEYYTSQEEGIAGAQEGTQDPQETEAYTGPRTLDGRPAPEAAAPAGSSSRSVPARRTGVATLGSMGGAAHGHEHGHGHDDDDNDSDFQDSEPEGQPRDLFAGGEKSGLAVHDPKRSNDPRKVVNDILKQAKANTPRSGGESSSAASTRFRGSGQTLGGDDAPSQTIPDPSPSSAAEENSAQTRMLHLWDDGFSIEDGPLRRFDDPQNAADLQMIRQGRAPLHLMGVRPEQPVDVQLIKHDEDYKAPPKIYKPFSGSGQRLGSPVPTAATLTTTTTAPPPTAPPTAPSSAPSSAPTASSEVDVDSSQPTISIRVQMGNGTRLPARFNTTHTIGDVYGFIERAAPNPGRDWVLATTFPNKDHTDKSQVLGDMPEFKRGGTAMQKWS